jgi:ethanolamine permease
LLVKINTGGTYGIARVALGLFPGFIISCLEAFQSIVIVAFTVVFMGYLITAITANDSSWEPMYWVLIHAFSIGLQTFGSRWFWRFNRVLAAAAASVLLIYVLGAIHYGDFSENAAYQAETGQRQWFLGEGSSFMFLLPTPWGMFGGIEALTLACRDVHDPKERVPRAYLWCIVVISCLAFAVIFATVSMNPGVSDTALADFPLIPGLMQILNCSAETALGLHLPAMYATFTGFMFCYGRQFRAMGKSGLINPFIGQDMPHFDTPLVALLTASGISLGFSIVVYLRPQAILTLLALALMSGTGMYMSLCCSFIVMRREFSSLERQFVNPFGVPGAVFSLVVFAALFVSAVGFQDQVFAVVVFGVGFILALVYYSLVVQERQYFSAEEQEVLFRVHLIKSKFFCSMCVLFVC